MATVFWIFSYNRGDFLRHCVDSIERCAPGYAIHIFDDNSSDPQTQAVLAALAEKYPVHYPVANGEATKHGGLYANMQTAYAQADADDILCFLQDDTQLVRPVAEDEMTRLRQYCRACGPGFVQAAFMHEGNRAKDAPMTRFDDAQGVYFVDRSKRSAGTYYSDVCVFHVQSLRDAGWQFVAKESRNETQARRLCTQPMAYWRDPFVAWLPNVPAFRGKTQTLALRWAEKIRACGFHPIHLMDVDSDRAFRERDPQQLPFAEDFLRIDADLPKPWIYYPLQGKSWLKHLNNAEVRLRRLLKL